MPTNGLDQPDAQVLLRMGYPDDSGAPHILEHMVRAPHPVQHPTCLPLVAYKVGIGHVCIVHIGRSSGNVAWASRTQRMPAQRAGKVWFARPHSRTAPSPLKPVRPALVLAHEFVLQARDLCLQHLRDAAHFARADGVTGRWGQVSLFSEKWET